MLKLNKSFNVSVEKGKQRCLLFQVLHLSKLIDQLFQSGRKFTIN